MPRYRKLVVTGAPCSGKSSLLQLIEAQGFQVVPEAARIVIGTQLKNEALYGKATLPWYPDQMEAFQGLVTEVQLESERKITNLGLPVFCDRSLVDQIAYCRVFGAKEPAGLRDAIYQANYDTVYMLAPVPYCTDEHRREDPATAQQIDQALRIAYAELEYQIIDVPDLGTPELRQALIFQHLGL